MKKLILQSLTIAAFNVVVGGLVTGAFFLLIMWNKPAIAVVCAVLALPGILLQPWFVIFIFMRCDLIIAPVLTTVVSIPVYAVLDQMGKLDRAKHFLSRLNKRKAVAVITGIVLCLLVFAYTRYIDLPALSRGVPRTLELALKDTDLEPGRGRYYCLPGFIDSHYLWQVKVSQHDLNLLSDKLQMHAISKNQVGEAFRDMPPYWWRPDISPQIRVMATTNFPMAARGPDGWHFLATWNPEDDVLHMWIKDNF